MKVESNIKKEVFQPIELKLTIESEEEARALYAIFNYQSNADLIDDYREILKSIGEKYYTTGGYIAKGIHADEFYRIKKSH